MISSSSASFDMLKLQAIYFLLLLLLFCCGCFTMQVDDFCERCYEETYILERRCEWSQDGESFTVHCRKRIDYCRDPFKINSGSEEISLSHIYSLTTPEPDAMLYRLKFVPDINWRRIGVSEAFADIKSKETLSYEKKVQVMSRRSLSPSTFMSMVDKNLIPGLRNTRQ